MSAERRPSPGARFDSSPLRIALSCALLVLFGACAGKPDSPAAERPDRPEPGLQGASVRDEGAGAVLAQPFFAGVNLVGHSPVWRRDANIQLAWAGDCAYISTSTPNFLGWGVTTAPEHFGVAVIDVSDPAQPVAVRVLRDPGALHASEAMHAVEAGDRRVLAASTYEKGSGPEDARWLTLYDATDCADPQPVSSFRWPEPVHAVTLGPTGRRVYATQIDPFAGGGGIHVLDIADLENPEYLGKFGVTRADGSGFEMAVHEIALSADETRIYAGVLGSQGDDLNEGIKPFPPSAAGLGPDAGGIYILDNSEIVQGKQNPTLRLVGTAHGGGWHSVATANIDGRPHLVGGGELGACPGAWPRVVDIGDERNPTIVGEFKLAMNHEENCPPRTPAEQASGGIIGSPGTASLHFNDVDSATDTRLGLFQFMWAGLRIADLRDPAAPVEVAYFKPGDACGGHVRYVQSTGHIWFACGKSGFYVIELKERVRRALGLPAAPAS